MAAVQYEAGLTAIMAFVKRSHGRFQCDESGEKPPGLYPVRCMRMEQSPANQVTFGIAWLESRK